MDPYWLSWSPSENLQAHKSWVKAELSRFIDPLFDPIDSADFSRSSPTLQRNTLAGWLACHVAGSNGCNYEGQIAGSSTCRHLQTWGKHPDFWRISSFSNTAMMRLARLKSKPICRPLGIPKHGWCHEPAPLKSDTRPLHSHWWTDQSHRLNALPRKTWLQLSLNQAWLHLKNPNLIGRTKAVLTALRIRKVWWRSPTQSRGPYPPYVQHPRPAGSLPWSRVDD